MSDNDDKGLVMMTWNFCTRKYNERIFAVLLPARRYASAGLCDCNVSLRPCVRHAPSKWRKRQRHDFFTIW